MGDCPPLSVPEGATQVSKRILTFAERVAYQYAIEEVYWRHRIWPKGNSRPKPALDEVISAAEVPKKAHNYLHQSQALDERWHRAITPPDLQAEIERMASHTKQPDVLRELFSALGNDPFVIAECLARPFLTARLVSELTSPGGVEAFVSNAAAVAAASDPTSQMYRLPEIAAPLDCANDTWTATTTVNAPEARTTRGTVWTGSEVIVWGGSNGNGLNTGGRYTPSTDTWTPTSTTNAPIGRGSHTVVWTGTEMIVWGGYNNPTGDLNTGGAIQPYHRCLDSDKHRQRACRTRQSHCGVDGTEMIIWAGRNDVVWMNTGGRYDPAADSWTATTTENAPAARWSHKAVWTGSEMIVWGGTNQTNYLHTGGRYYPAIDRWVSTSVVNAPIGRVAHSAIWTDNEMIIWGGGVETSNFTNTGGRYSPNTDSWTATSLANAPSPRSSHRAVWTGREMIVWGGYYFPPPGLNSTLAGDTIQPATVGWLQRRRMHLLAEILIPQSGLAMK